MASSAQQGVGSDQTFCLWEGRLRVCGWMLVWRWVLWNAVYLCHFADNLCRIDCVCRICAVLIFIICGLTLSLPTGKRQAQHSRESLNFSPQERWTLVGFEVGVMKCYMNNRSSSMFSESVKSTSTLLFQLQTECTMYRYTFGGGWTVNCNLLNLNSKYHRFVFDGVYILRKAFQHCGVSLYASGLPWSFLCLCCGSGQNLYLLWRGPTVITSNTYHIALHPGGFLPVVAYTFNSQQNPTNLKAT